MRVIYNDGDINLDVIGLLAYINNFTKALGVENVVIDDVLCQRVLQVMREDFPHDDGIDKASVFKKLANFIVWFISERPIQSVFPESAIGSKLSKIPNHQNSIVAFQLALDNLTNATIESSSDQEKKLISNPIEISKHSYIDIINALSKATPSTHFQMVSVLLEQLVYKTNPECQSDMCNF